MYRLVFAVCLLGPSHAVAGKEPFLLGGITLGGSLHCESVVLDARPVALSRGAMSASFFFGIRHSWTLNDRKGRVCASHVMRCGSKGLNSIDVRCD